MHCNCFTILESILYSKKPGIQPHSERFKKLTFSQQYDVAKRVVGVAGGGGLLNAARLLGINREEDDEECGFGLDQ